MADSRYDIVQTTFLLSIAANGASGIEAPEAKLRGYLDAALNGGADPLGGHFGGFFPQMNAKLAGGDWAVAWGPCVYSVRDEKKKANATNAMYVAHSATLNTYVVAIAATNPISIFDWLKEDAQVQPDRQVEWARFVGALKSGENPMEAAGSPPSADTPAISAGTALGVSDLLHNPSMRDAKTGKALLDFLQGVNKQGQTLIFAGHSLAGALSPTLALYVQTRLAGEGWAAIHVLPTAGASPGNVGFSKLFAEKFPKVTVPEADPSYGFWNVDIANGHDVVPHAWDKLDQVLPRGGHGQSIFGVVNDVLEAELRLSLDLAMRRSKDGNYLSIPQQMVNFNWGCWRWHWDAAKQGWAYPPMWTALQPYGTHNKAKPSDLGDLILYTHVHQYYRFFKVIPSPRMPTSVPKEH